MKNLFHHLFLYSIILSSFLILAACSGGHQYRTMLNRADSLMTAHPDSAYAIITSIDSVSIHKQRKAVRMRYELLRAEAHNKLYVPFTTDSVMRKVAAYYNSPWRKYILRSSHSASNEALKSLYLLGCVYRDLHEAPIAILTWEDAIATADTTNADCDYATLYRVYGQMADLYHRQNMLDKLQIARESQSQYALKAHDLYGFIRGIELQVYTAYLRHDTAGVYRLTDRAYKLYKDAGMDQDAARVFPTAILTSLENRNITRAEDYIKIYENKSGLFDENGNISDPTRSQYYYYKGIYYLGVHKLDSAEHQFRKLLSVPPRVLDAYRGLFNLYQVKHNADSAFKYGRRYEAELSRYVDGFNGEAVIQAQAMYNYQRQEKIATKERKKSQFLTSITVLLCLAAISSFLYSRRKRKAKAEAMRKLELAFAQTEEDLESAKAELRLLRSCVQDVEDQNLIIQKLEERIRRQESQLKHDAQILGKLDAIERDQRLMRDETVLLFQRISHSHKETRNGKTVKKSSRKAYKKEWIALFKTIKKEHLSCYIAIEGCESLSPQERQVAYLSRINLQTQEMATIIGCLPQSISNSRSGISHKLFKSDDTLKINKKLKEL